jgi:threonine synthase
VVLATAHPSKFPGVVEQATGLSVDVPRALASHLAGVEQIEYISATADALRDILLRGAD